MNVDTTQTKNLKYFQDNETWYEMGKHIPKVKKSMYFYFIYPLNKKLVFKINPLFHSANTPTYKTLFEIKNLHIFTYLLGKIAFRYYRS